MANLIVPADFDIPPYDIPNLTPKVNSFIAFIGVEQAKILRKLLGAAVYTELEPFLTYPTIDAGADQKWKDLYDGADYSIDGVYTYHWDGLKAILKPYIFYKWLMSRNEQMSNIGAVKGKGENSTSESPIRKIHAANLEFRTLVGECSYCGKQDSLYGFMTANKEANFPTWIFKEPSKINALGI